MVVFKKAIPRRTFLRVGGLSALGLTLSGFLRLQKAAAEDGTERRNVNCILMWMQGGPSHHDTFDPKPDAPAEIRGEFGTVPTTLPGVRIAEHLPLLARQTDKYSIIRGHDPKNLTAACLACSARIASATRSSATWPSAKMMKQ